MDHKYRLALMGYQNNNRDILCAVYDFIGNFHYDGTTVLLEDGSVDIDR